jgi:hypothetical protein
VHPTEEGIGVAKTIERTVDIDADAPTVWAVVRDLPAFASWNPFMHSASGEVKEGARLTITMGLEGQRPMTFSPRVLEVVEGRRLRWLGKVGPGGLFNGEHTLSIEPREGGGVRFVNHERFTGILVPFMGSTLRKAEKSFEAMNAALKARAEGGAAARGAP